jgi:aminoglycoside phosphotransferase (APT) family kinase protein
MAVALEEAVRDLVRAAGLGPGGEVERMPDGLMHDVFRVDRELVVRVGTGPGAARDFPKAASVLRAIAGRLPAPRLLYTDFTRSRLAGEVIVCSQVEGERLSALWPGLGATERLLYGAQVGDALEALHAVPPDGIPELADLGPWPERAAEDARAALERARRERALAPPRLDRMQACLEGARWALESAPPAVLVHYDVHWENVIVRDGAIAALLDFDDVRLAPAEQDWWELLFASNLHDDPRADVEWFAKARGHELRAPGCLERFLVDEIGEIVRMLTEEVGWVDRDTARREAQEAYVHAFESDFYPELLARVSS